MSLTKHSIIMLSFTTLAAFFNYLYQLLMGRLLTPEEYGILFSLINIFYIFSVLSLTVQNTLAKYTSQLRVRNKLHEISFLWRYALIKSIKLGLITTVLFLAITPFLSSYLHLPSPLPPIILFSSIPLAYALPTNGGVLQGLQRFVRLGITQVFWAFLKLSLGVMFVYFGLGISGALLPFPIANVIVFLLSIFFLIDIISLKPKSFKIAHLYEYSTLTLLALLAYTTSYSIDTILAKHYLNDFLAGIYASVSVLGKIILFTPGGIAIVLFPKASEFKEKGLNHFILFIKALALTILLTLPILAIFKLAPNFTIKFIFGEKYLSAVPYLTNYGLAMFFFAIAGLMMNYLLSLGRTEVSYFMLLSLLVEIVGLSLFNQNIDQIISVILISSILSVVLQLPVMWGAKDD